MARKRARRSRTVTLFGGFASTVCWPLSALFVEWLGWRGTCFAFAVLHLGLTLPFYWLVLPKVRTDAPPCAPHARAAGGTVDDQVWSREGNGFCSGSWRPRSASAGASPPFSPSISSPSCKRAGSNSHRQWRSAPWSVPSQVCGRLFEMMFGKHYRPIHTLLISVVLVAAGLTVLATGSDRCGRARRLRRRDRHRVDSPGDPAALHLRPRTLRDLGGSSWRVPPWSPVRWHLSLGPSCSTGQARRSPYTCSSGWLWPISEQPWCSGSFRAGTTSGNRHRPRKRRQCRASVARAPFPLPRPFGRPLPLPRRGANASFGSRPSGWQLSRVSVSKVVIPLPARSRPSAKRPSSPFPLLDDAPQTGRSFRKQPLRRVCGALAA